MWPSQLPSAFGFSFEMIVKPHCGCPFTSVGIGSTGERSIPTILPQSASPHGEIATTPWPFAVHQVPTGLSVGLADAIDMDSPITNTVEQKTEARDPTRLIIATTPGNWHTGTSGLPRVRR
jgi:hypothetical protein